MNSRTVDGRLSTPRKVKNKAGIEISLAGVSKPKFFQFIFNLSKFAKGFSSKHTRLSLKQCEIIFDSLAVQTSYDPDCLDIRIFAGKLIYLDFTSDIIDVSERDIIYGVGSTEYILSLLKSGISYNDYHLSGLRFNDKVQ